MKIDSFKRVLALSVVLLVSNTMIGHTAAESNQIVRAMLYSATPMATGCTNDKAGISRKQWAAILKSHHPEVFFGSFCTNSGWTYEGRVTAFDNFISTMGDMDFFDSTNEYRHCVVMAVSQCRDMNYVKAAEPIRRLVHNLSYPPHLRSRAIDAAIHLGGLSDESTAFVDSIITNQTVFSSDERSKALEGYAGILHNVVVTNETGARMLNSALSMLYRNRMIDWENAFDLDELFCSRIDGYSMSSNRLELAEHVLSVADCWQATRDRFTSVTNQLLSSGQPLLWIDIGAGGN